MFIYYLIIFTINYHQIDIWI